jgi:sodium pump decarboxylase gamma subunit
MGGDMDRLLFGLGVTVVGMVIVFIGLAILIVCINLLKSLSKEKESRAATPGTESMAQVSADEVPLPAIFSAVAAVMNQEEQEQLVAVLTAAVAALWEEETGFVVRRVRRIETSPAWQKAGREEQVYSRL